MMKRNVVMICRWIVELALVVYLKGIYLDRNVKTDFSSIQDILFVEEAQVMAMIFWLLPFLISLIEIGFTFYHQLVHFDFRYKGRTQYINRLTLEYTGKAILYAVLFSCGQLLYFHASDLKSCLVVTVNMCLVFYNLNVMAVVLSLVFTKYIYAMLVVVAVLFSITFFPPLLQSLPIAGSFYTEGIDIGAGLLVICMMVLIRKVYLHMDLRGDFT